MSRKRSIDWVVFGPGHKDVQCLRCGRVHEFDLPMPIKAFAKWAQAIVETHANCEDQEQRRQIAANVRGKYDSIRDSRLS